MVDILGDDPLQHVKLAIRTPKATWPTEGFLEIPVGETVRNELIRAVEALGIEADTTGWEAWCEGRIIDASATFCDNGLEGECIIRFVPPAIDIGD